MALEPLGQYLTSFRAQPEPLLDLYIRASRDYNGLAPARGRGLAVKFYIKRGRRTPATTINWPIQAVAEPRLSYCLDRPVGEWASRRSSGALMMSLEDVHSIDTNSQDGAEGLEQRA